MFFILETIIKKISNILCKKSSSVMTAARNTCTSVFDLSLKKLFMCIDLTGNRANSGLKNSASGVSTPKTN